MGNATLTSDPILRVFSLSLPDLGVAIDSLRLRNGLNAAYYHLVLVKAEDKESLISSSNDLFKNMANLALVFLEEDTQSTVTTILFMPWNCLCTALCPQGFHDLRIWCPTCQGDKIVQHMTAFSGNHREIKGLYAN